MVITSLRSAFLIHSFLPLQHCVWRFCRLCCGFWLLLSCCHVGKAQGVLVPRGPSFIWRLPSLLVALCILHFWWFHGCFQVWGIRIVSCVLQFQLIASFNLQVALIFFFHQHHTFCLAVVFWTLGVCGLHRLWHPRNYWEGSLGWYGLR